MRPQPQLIIDSHCHAGKGDGLTGPWDTDAPLGAYLSHCAEAGITGSVLFAAFSSDYRRANREVAAIVRSQPGRFVGYAFVDTVRDQGRLDALVSEAVLRYGFRGIKAHRHDGRMTRELCETAQRWRLPVLFDVMGETAPIELFAREYPDVAFIIPHLGSFADDWRAQRSFLDILARRSNVFTDTSGVRRHDLLEEAVARAGPGKILFGTDGPWLHPGVELAKVRLLHLPAAAEEAVLGGNLLRLLRRVRRSPAGTSAGARRESAPSPNGSRAAEDAARPTTGGRR